MRCKQPQTTSSLVLRRPAVPAADTVCVACRRPEIGAIEPAKRLVAVTGLGAYAEQIDVFLDWQHSRSRVLSAESAHARAACPPFHEC
jgi:hypothetical protein